jgi:hypothetical protein
MRSQTVSPQPIGPANNEHGAIGRCQVDGDAAGGDLGARVPHGGTDALASLKHGAPRQAD